MFARRVFFVASALLLTHTPSVRAESVQQIRTMPKPGEVPSNTLIEDLLWSDPAEDPSQVGFTARTKYVMRFRSYEALTLLRLLCYAVRYLLLRGACYLFDQEWNEARM